MCPILLGSDQPPTTGLTNHVKPSHGDAHSHLLLHLFLQSGTRLMLSRCVSESCHRRLWPRCVHRQVVLALAGVLQAPGCPPRHTSHRPPCSCGRAAAVLQRRVFVNAALKSSTAGAMASDIGMQTVDLPLIACSSAPMSLLAGHPARSACSTACWRSLCSCLTAHACLGLPRLRHRGGLRPSSSLS
jgi:hypothetical protein